MINDKKLRGKCFGCKKTKWFLRKPHIILPGTNIPVTGRNLVCKQCEELLKAIK